MYPITQNKLIYPSDLYTHFLVEAIPIKNSTSAASFTLVDNGTIKSKHVALPISITPSNNEIWRVDIYIYGLGIKDPTSSTSKSLTTPEVMKIFLTKSGETSGLFLSDRCVPTNDFNATGSGTSHHYGPGTMRHQAALINFQEGRVSWQIITGQIAGTTCAQEGIGTGTISSSGPISGPLTHIYIVGSTSTTTIKYAYISGLYLEFTRLSPTNPTNGYNSVIL